MKKVYDRDTAVAYARKWAFGRNPAYYYFGGIGGDCTNFISQCIKAGGAPENFTKDTGWYYISPSNRAAAWTSVEYLYRFLIRQEKIGPKGKVVPIKDVQIGDVIQLAFEPNKYSHSLLVVKTGKVPTPQNVLIATHSDSALDRPLSSYSYVSFRCIHISI